MKRSKSYLFKCRTPFKNWKAISVPSSSDMEPALSSSPGSSFSSRSLSDSAMQRIWYELHAGTEMVLTDELKALLIMGYSNLPCFLQRFCELYYGCNMSLQSVADALGASLQLAEQRRVVSISLFRILLACKPKNPV